MIDINRIQPYCDELLNWLLNDVRDDLLHSANGLCIVSMYLQTWLRYTAYEGLCGYTEIDMDHDRVSSQFNYPVPYSMPRPQSLSKSHMLPCKLP